jgi:DedD protein
MAGAKGSRGGGGDRVLESRHLVGMFLGVVFLCGVFFTLGYVMGRTQYGNPVHAAESLVRNAPRLMDPGSPSLPAPKTKTEPSAQPAPASGEWDFYSKRNSDAVPAPSSSKAPVNSPMPAVSTKRPGSPPIASTRTAVGKPLARFQPPSMLKGSITLQIAALTREADALSMADELQQKRFPSFVVTPTTDNYYRVQVGPYPDLASAEAAKRQLDHQGFKVIIKR